MTLPALTLTRNAMQTPLSAILRNVRIARNAAPTSAGLENATPAPPTLLTKTGTVKKLTSLTTALIPRLVMRKTSAYLRTRRVRATQTALIRTFAWQANATTA